MQKHHWLSLRASTLFPVEGVQLGDRKHPRAEEGGREGAREEGKED